MVLPHFAHSPTARAATESEVRQRLESRAEPYKVRTDSGAWKGNALREVRPRLSAVFRRTASLAVLAAFLASCNAVVDPDVQASSPSYTSTGEETANAQTAIDSGSVSDSGSDSAPDLPQSVTALPASNPVQPEVVSPAAAATADTAATASPEEAASANLPKTAAVAEQAAAATPTDGDQGTTAKVDPASAGDGSVLTAAPPAAAPKPKKVSALAALFGTSQADPALQTNTNDRGGPIASARPAKAAAEQPQLKMASIDPGDADQRQSFGGDDLPGVRKTALFEIKRRSGLDDDADVDIYEDSDSAPVLTASAAGMARMSPNGLRTQTESVDVACLKPSLVRVLKTIESHYGRPMVVTSGYRSPSHNRQARGAKNSLHMYCAAADVQIAGVGKWELARYARSMSGRGGVGTYCHTESVHIDVGPERDWNWRCRGRRK